MRTTIQIDLDEACTLIGEALNAKTPGKRHQVSVIIDRQEDAYMDEGRPPIVRFEANVTDFPKRG